MAADVPAPRGRSGWKDLRDVVPAAVLVSILFACFLWPLIYTVSEPIGGQVRESNLPILSPGHLLGTDLNGNDVWSRLLHGGQASLRIAIAANVFGLLLGGFLGALSAYVGGITDSVVMRALDVLIAFPSLVIVLAIAQTLGPSEVNTVLALLFFSVPAFARVARAATLPLREQPFMMAARLSGTSNLRVLVRHVAPNICPQLMTFGLLGVGIAVTIEGSISYLGLGVPQPHPSWGNMIADGQHLLLTRPMLVLLPGAFLFLTALSCNLLGERIRERWSG
jgi:peptide/nickel transport system permease protein